MVLFLETPSLPILMVLPSCLLYSTEVWKKRITYVYPGFDASTLFIGSRPGDFPLLLEVSITEMARSRFFGLAERSPTGFLLLALAALALYIFTSFVLLDNSAVTFTDRKETALR